MSSGYFESWSNGIAYRPTERDRGLVRAVEAEARRALGQSSSVRWGGSNNTRTAIEGSDLDLFVVTGAEVTHNQRREFARRLGQATGREAQILGHAVRLLGSPQVDVSFGTSFFGERSAPDRSDFFGQPHRQQAVRALKFWSRRGAGLPEMKGWVAEAIVKHLDQQSSSLSGWELFLKILDWFANRAKPGDVEAILRPVSQYPWAKEWSDQVRGQLEAFGNDARRLLKRDFVSKPFGSERDVDGWLLNQG